jgi:hypothetical protein
VDEAFKKAGTEWKQLDAARKLDASEKQIERLENLYAKRWNEANDLHNELLDLVTEYWESYLDADRMPEWVNPNPFFGLFGGKKQRGGAVTRCFTMSAFHKRGGKDILPGADYPATSKAQAIEKFKEDLRGWGLRVSDYQLDAELSDDDC